MHQTLTCVMKGSTGRSQLHRKHQLAPNKSEKALKISILLLERLWSGGHILEMRDVTCLYFAMRDLMFMHNTGAINHMGYFMDEPVLGRIKAHTQTHKVVLFS